MQWILEALRDTRSSRVLYVFRAVLIVSLPAVVGAVIGQLVGLRSLSTIPSEPWPMVSKELRLALTLLDIVVLAPFIETALCFLPIFVLRRFGLPSVWIALLSALGWGVLHVWRGSFVSIVSVWCFFCFTLMLQALDQKSRDGAWLQVSIVHGLSNAAVLLACVPFWLYTATVPNT